MAEPNIPEVKPDEKLLKKVVADNKAIKEKVKFREEAPKFENHSAVSSDERVKALNK